MSGPYDLNDKGFALIKDVRSRSMQKRQAAQRGEPMPTFSGDSLVPDGVDPSTCPHARTTCHDCGTTWAKGERQAR